MTRQPGSRPTVGVRLAGTGMALPGRILTNDELAQLVDTSDQWITQRTGIKQRYVVEEEGTTKELALGASRQALAAAALDPKDLDLLICATITPEMCCPSTAARLVDELGATPAGAMDISVACSGFVYGLNIAESLIRTGMYRNIVVVGAEVLSKITDWKDRRTCILFGDGAGAAVLTGSDDSTQGTLYHSMASDGGQWGSLYCPRSERDLPAKHSFSGTYQTLQMNGREVYKFAVATMVATIGQTFEATGVGPADLAMIIPHQSNSRILESARKKLGLSEQQVYSNIDRYGNTSAASIPICLHELLDAGRIKKGDLILFVALGGGLTWATNLWRL